MTSKRHLVHIVAFKLGLLLHTLLGAGTPRGFRDLLARTETASATLWAAIRRLRRVRSFWGPLTRMIRRVPYA